jgi:hypothetical protein
METAERPELFPPTPSSMLLHCRGSDCDGRRQVARRVMGIYASPLVAYLRSTSFRRFGDPVELVNGFFASRLDDDHYLVKWATSGIRLRRWLINGLLLYLHEQVRSERRHRRLGALPESLAAAVDRGFEQVYARSLVQQAMDIARARCEAEGQSMHWTCFLARHGDAGALATLRQEHGLSSGQSSHMVRVATARFRKALVELVLLDGATPGEADLEIQRLLRSLGS